LGRKFRRLDEDLQRVVLASIGRKPRPWRLLAGSVQAFQPWHAAVLAEFARQNCDVMEGQVGRDRKWRAWRRIPVVNVHHKPGDRIGRTGAILNGVLAVEIDGLRSIWALRENADAAADADDGCRRLHRDRALMAELAADILQRALRQFGQHVAAIGSGIVDQLVDHQTGIRRNTQGAFVEKQKLYGAGRRGVNAFLVQHARADGERGGRAAGRRGLATD